MSNKPISEKEVIKAAQEVLPQGTRIVFAPQNEVELLGPWVDRVLEALGFDAWVTDMSTIGDFFDRGDDYDQWLNGLSVTLDLPKLQGNDYIHDVARKLRDRELH